MDQGTQAGAPRGRAIVSETVLRVIDQGLSTTVQDFGRFGSQKFGVSASGAIDPWSLALANHLAGNAPDAAGLEMTMTGGDYEVMTDRLDVALVGAEMPLAIDGANAPANETHRLRRGQRIAVGAARSGLRAYLAIGGGIAVARILGSRATHLRSGVGGIEGRALHAGDEIPGAPPAVWPAALRLKRDRRPYFGGVIRIIAGPQDNEFAPYAIDMLVAGHYRLSTQFDRMAVRVDGPALPLRDGFNIVSDGIVAGSIQVPGHGQPLILLADRQTTGGYPKIGVVTTPDLARIGQRRPHERVRFHRVPPDEAEDAYIRWASDFDRIDEFCERLPER